MAMKKRRRSRQEALFVATDALPESPGHPFYEKLNEVLAEHGFDDFVEDLCAQYYAEKLGRPSIPPGVYFRMLMLGFYEGLDSERGIDWRVADSLTLHEFLGYAVTERTPHHSTLSRTRKRLPLEVHQEVFNWILTLVASSGLLKGKTLGVDATTLEANAAMRSIVRRDSGETYDEFLTRLAQASGIETPTREDLAKIDKNRPKKASNKDWRHPHDPDARITKMKDGRTHLAHKAEHSVDMDTETILAVTLQEADEGDTATLPWTLLQAQMNLEAVSQDPEAKAHLHAQPLSEVVADKGYHSRATMAALKEDKIRSYISEPDRGRQKWKGKTAERDAVYANRRRIRGDRGQALRRQRGEYVERPFAHLFETGSMRRVHLRGQFNILKRLLIHAGGFNLALAMRKLVGVGTPRGLRDLFIVLQTLLYAPKTHSRPPFRLLSPIWRRLADFLAPAAGAGPRWPRSFLRVSDGL